MVKSDPNFYIIGWVSLIWVGRKKLDGQPDNFFCDLHREIWFKKKKHGFSNVTQTPTYDSNFIWVNYNISPTWIKAISGWFPLLTMIIVRSQWGRLNLPRLYVIPVHRNHDLYRTALISRFFNPAFSLTNCLETSTKKRGMHIQLPA